MRTSSRISCTCVLAVALSLLALPASADTIYWTNWTAQNPGSPGSAIGTVTFPDGSVTVTYSGEVIAQGDLGDWNYPQTYTLPGLVDNTPTPQYVSVPLYGVTGITNTISFSSPVLDPVMAIQSLGSGWDVSTYVFVFDSPFTLLNYGPGHWGGGGPGSLVQSGLSLTGIEGNGIIQFSGQFSSISWTVPDGEYYSMFTVGAPSAAVPEPASLLLLGTGLVGLARWRRRRP